MITGNSKVKARAQKGWLSFIICSVRLYIIFQAQGQNPSLAFWAEPLKVKVRTETECEVKNSKRCRLSTSVLHIDSWQAKSRKCQLLVLLRLSCHWSHVDDVWLVFVAWMSALIVSVKTYHCPDHSVMSQILSVTKSAACLKYLCMMNQKPIPAVVLRRLNPSYWMWTVRWPYMERNCSTRKGSGDMSNRYFKLIIIIIMVCNNYNNTNVPLAQVLDSVTLPGQGGALKMYYAFCMGCATLWVYVFTLFGKDIVFNCI